MFTKVLVANRGEIAVRILRACNLVAPEINGESLRLSTEIRLAAYCVWGSFGRLCQQIANRVAFTAEFAGGPVSCAIGAAVAVGGCKLA